MELEEDADVGAEGLDSQQQDQAEPSEQDARALVERLREAPAEEMLAEVLSMLLSTAQVKLGRRDARLFIDLSAVLLDHAQGSLPDELRAQADAALNQLRMAQVAAEREVAAAGAPEPNDLAAAPLPPPAVRFAGSPQAADSPSRLWVPGR